MNSVVRCFPLLAAMTLGALSGSSLAESTCDKGHRVVAIADVHGDFDAMVRTLQQADILDSNRAWAGKSSRLVIAGDILDRGPDSRAAMDLLMRIENEAAAAGGEVNVLIGNHESMLLTGDMRYVSDAEYAAFAGEANAEDRSRWLALYAKRIGVDVAAVQDEFESKFPPGYFAMRRAFRADGQYGQWLLQKDIVAVIDKTAFVHGGLSPEIAKLGLDGINGQLRNELVEYVNALNVLTDAEVLLPTDSHYEYQSLLENYLPSLDESEQVMQALGLAMRLEGSALLDTDGPLWYRRGATCPRIVEDQRLIDALDAIGAERLVVGHTPTPNRQVLQRFDGRLIEIDTGMLGDYYSGSGHALVLHRGEVRVVNESGSSTTEIAEHPRRVGRRASALSADALEALLQTGILTPIEFSSTEPAALPGQTWVSVSDGENTVNALFSKSPGRGVYPDVAAYRLDRILELDMVPVAVVRELDGRKGSLQFMPDERVDEPQRAAAGDGGSATCPIAVQWTAMYLFDALIFNEGRTPQRILYDPGSWRLILSQHDFSFGRKKGLPAYLKSVDLDVDEGWRPALLALDDDSMVEQFGDVLDKRRIRALGARRDELLSRQ